jgi:hypothetical protein
MAFNIHVSRIVDNPTTSEPVGHANTSKNSRMPQPKVYKTPSLVNVPAGNVIPKYRVQIFEVHAEA